MFQQLVLESIGKNEMSERNKDFKKTWTVQTKIIEEIHFLNQNNFPMVKQLQNIKETSFVFSTCSPFFHLGICAMDIQVLPHSEVNVWFN